MPQSLSSSPEIVPERIRVLAADSSRMSSQLLAQALAQDGNFHVTGTEPKSASILAAVADEKPHVVLMSSVLEESATGFDLIRQVCATHPDTRVVMLMDTSKRSAVVEAFRCGAQGVFSRTESPKALAKCICSVHNGQVWANSAELRYLPPYSPDMNPIEKAFSKLKAFLRKIAERSVPGLINALETCAKIFKPSECVNYFRACGYDTDW